MSTEQDREALCRVMDASDPEMGGVVADEGHESWEWYIPMADAILAAGFRRTPAPAPDVQELIRKAQSRAWFRGHSTGIFDTKYETGTRNPYIDKGDES